MNEDPVAFLGIAVVAFVAWLTWLCVKAYYAGKVDDAEKGLVAVTKENVALRVAIDAMAITDDAIAIRDNVLAALDAGLLRE